MPHQTSNISSAIHYTYYIVIPPIRLHALHHVCVYPPRRLRGRGAGRGPGWRAGRDRPRRGRDSRGRWARRTRSACTHVTWPTLAMTSLHTAYIHICTHRQDVNKSVQFNPRPHTFNAERRFPFQQKSTVSLTDSSQWASRYTGLI